MAYLHCHTKNCDWSQDDFWSFKIGKYGYWKFPFSKFGIAYNPISVFLSYVCTKKGYWKPRRIVHDSSWAKEAGWSRKDPHSWWLAWQSFKDIFRRFKGQKWWTYESWKSDYDKGIAVCPNCGQKNFDID